MFRQLIGRAMMKHKVISALLFFLLSLAGVTGCSLQRTGQCFLSTLEDYHRVAYPPTGDRWILALVDPFVYVGCFVGMFTFGPVSDIVFLPYDIYLSRNEGSDVVVVDEDMRPIRDASVKVVFWNTNTEVNGKTDADGVFHVGANCNLIYNGTAIVERDGYYPEKWFWRVTGGPYPPLGSFSVQTAVLSRVEHPISLAIRTERFRGDSKEVWRGYANGKWRKLMAEGGVVGYDFIKGDWIPPFGRGSKPDAIFKLKDDQQVDVEFPGASNGVICVNSKVASGVIMREAPAEGYERVCTVSEKGKSDLLGMYFRIRDCLYGKITGDFKMDVHRGGGYLDNSSQKYIWSLAEPEWATRIRFDYFLNSEPGNRNLEQLRDGQYWCRKFSQTGEP